MTRRRRVSAAALCLGAVGAAHAGEPGPAREALLRTWYDFEVASYCSLVDARVSRGFRARVSALTADAALSPEALDALRGRAWQAAHAEWQNRGLGGFRAWCRGDGLRAARALAAHGAPHGGGVTHP